MAEITRTRPYRQTVDNDIPRWLLCATTGAP